MKTRKLLSIALAILMLLLAFPVTALAAVSSTAATDGQITTAVVSIWYDNGGTQTKLGDYNNMDAAFEALKGLYSGPLADATLTDKNGNGLSDELYAAAGSPVIKLNGNFQGAYARPNWATNNGEGFIKYDPNKVITIVIDGAKSATENYTMTFGTESTAFTETIFNYMAFYNLTVKNTNFVIHRGGNTSDNNFLWKGNADDVTNVGTSYTVFENCLIDQKSTLSNSDQGGLFKLNGKAKSESKNNFVDPYGADKFNLTFKDSTVIARTAIMLQVHWGADANINVINSTLSLEGTAGNGDNNDTLLKFYECGDVNVTVDGTSKLISKRAAGSGSSALLRDMSSVHYPVTYTLEKGAELRMENTAPNMTKLRFIGAFGTDTKIIDKGAVFYASANDVKSGVTLPTIVDDNGNAELWKNGDAIISTEVYKDTAATAPVTFTHEKIADPALNPANVAYIELANGKKTYYTSLKDAVNAVNDLYPAVGFTNNEALWKDAGSPIIYVYKDINISSTITPSWFTSSYSLTRVKTVYIKSGKADGTNAKITSTADGAAFRGMAYYNFTLENIDLECNGGFALFWAGYDAKNSGASTTNLINCNITASGTSGEGLVFKVTGNQDAAKMYEDYKINFVNTDVVADMEGTTGVNAVFLLHHGCAGTINIDKDSSITHEQNRATAGGDTMFMMGTNRKFEINIEGGAALTANVTKVLSSGTYKDSYAMFRLENSNSYPSDDRMKNIINIGEGAKLTINANDTYAGTAYFVDNGLAPANLTKTVLGIDKGVEFIVNAKAAALGFEIIRGQTPTYGNATIVGWQYGEGENAVFTGDDVFDANEVGAVTIKSVAFTEEDFGVITGASIYTVSGKSGLRFSTKVSAEFLALVGDNAKFGTILALNHNLGLLELTLDTAAMKFDVPVAKALESDKTKWEKDGTDSVYRVALNNMGTTSDAYRTNVAARGYVTVTYTDGSTGTFYTNFNADENVRSMYSVARALKLQGNNTEVVNTIIDTATVW